MARSGIFNDQVFLSLLEMLGETFETYVELNITERLKIVEQYQTMKSLKKESSQQSFNKPSHGTMAFTPSKQALSSSGTTRKTTTISQPSLDILNSDFERNRPEPILDKSLAYRRLIRTQRYLNLSNVIQFRRNTRIRLAYKTQEISGDWLEHCTDQQVRWVKRLAYFAYLRDEEEVRDRNDDIYDYTRTQLPSCERVIAVDLKTLFSKVLNAVTIKAFLGFVKQMEGSREVRYVTIRDGKGTYVVLLGLSLFVYIYIYMILYVYLSMCVNLFFRSL